MTEKNPQLEEFVDAYFTCALWASTTGDDVGTPLDKDHGFEDIPDDIEKQMQEDCKKFYDENHGLFEGQESQAGHDFWLNRNGHGCGFWDGDWPEPQATKLDEASKAFGGYTLIAGSDGAIDGWKGN